MDKLKLAYESLRNLTDFQAEIGITLGSGLDKLADNIDIEQEISYKDISGMPTSSVSGHRGSFIFGTLGGKKVVAMRGRVHYYEGYTSQEVVMPIRLMAMLGAKTVILTNASGGVNESFNGGDIMLLTDHISLVPSPLIGKNDDSLGERFPDMSEVYDKSFQSTVLYCAEKLGIELKQGVYIQFSGPNYETPAEVRMARTLGADAVGMSTAIEAVALRHMKVKVIGLSCICNKGAGMGGKLSHIEVKQAADKIGINLSKLIIETVKQL